MKTILIGLLLAIACNDGWVNRTDISQYVVPGTFECGEVYSFCSFGHVLFAGGRAGMVRSYDDDALDMI